MLGKKTVVFYLAAVFAAGLLAGGVAGFGLGKRRAFVPPRPQDMATHMCERLKSKLHLTPEQEKQIKPLVDEAAVELESVHSATAERIREVIQKLNRRQAQFLSPEQKASLEEMDRERQKFFHKESKTIPGLPQPGPAASPKAN